MNTATPFPWTGPTAAENARTGFGSIFEHAPLPAARCNPQGVIIEKNSAFAQPLQARFADQRALRLSDLVAPDDREATESLLHNLLACTCDSIHLAGRNTAKNGQTGLAVTNWMDWRLPGSGEEPNHALLIAEPNRDGAPLEEGPLQAQRWEAVSRDHRKQYCHHKRRTDSRRKRSGSRNPSHDPAAPGIALPRLRISGRRHSTFRDVQIRPDTFRTTFQEFKKESHL